MILCFVRREDRNVNDIDATLPRKIIKEINYFQRIIKVSYIRVG